MPIRASILMAILFVGAPAATGMAQTITAGFEGYSVGFQGNAPLGSSLIEPANGIVFSEPTGPLGAGSFYVIHASTAGPAPVLPGNYLVGGNAVFGPTSGPVFEQDFDFSATFPVLTNRVEMDLLYRTISEASSVTLTAFGPGGQFLMQEVFTLPAHNLPVGVQGTLTVQHAMLLSGDLIQKVVVNSSANAQVGFDNISIPEPSAVLSLAFLGLLLRRR